MELHIYLPLGASFVLIIITMFFAYGQVIKYLKSERVKNYSQIPAEGWDNLYEKLLNQKKSKASAKKIKEKEIIEEEKMEEITEQEEQINPSEQ